VALPQLGRLLHTNMRTLKVGAVASLLGVVLWEVLSSASWWLYNHQPAVICPPLLPRASSPPAAVPSAAGHLPPPPPPPPARLDFSVLGSPPASGSACSRADQCSFSGRREGVWQQQPTLLDVWAATLQENQHFSQAQFDGSDFCGQFAQYAASENTTKEFDILVLNQASRSDRKRHMHHQLERLQWVDGLAEGGMARVLRPPTYDHLDMPAAVGVPQSRLWSMRELQPWADEETQAQMIRRLLHPGRWIDDHQHHSHWDRDSTHQVRAHKARADGAKGLRQQRICGKLHADAPVQTFAGLDVPTADMAAIPAKSAETLHHCSTECNVRAECVAFAYIPGSRGGCYLKSAKPFLEDWDGVIKPNEAVTFGLKSSCFETQTSDAAEARQMAQAEARLRVSVHNHKPPSPPLALSVPPMRVLMHCGGLA
jgi:hypothetical protein